ncbi:MAG: hypothetical protein RL021_1957 [Bacteroidota bacterium]|jgi:hemoglobin/transferrin/lactoferrin receptor protein
MKKSHRSRFAIHHNSICHAADYFSAHLLQFLMVFTSLLLSPFISFGSPIQTDSLRGRDLDEVVISVNRMEEVRSEVAEQVAVIDSATISRTDAATMADVLQQNGTLFVQKSQLGGGSPVIRGFEASRVLLVIDDVRMNNLIYRSGHLQNLITVDPSILERTEVLFGPSSTVYGSDALGGVINLRTRQPLFSTDEAVHTHGSGHIRLATAASEKTIQANASVSAGRWASLTAISLSDFGDLRMGERAGTLDSVWGQRFYYADRINGRDTLLKNDDVFIQRNSGYRQYDFLEKVSIKTASGAVHGLDFQYSTSGDVPRYDRLTDPAGAGLKYAEWYYGPQQRLLTAYRLDRPMNGFFNRLKGVASYQSVVESRHSRSFGRAVRTDRTEKVDVGALTVFADHQYDERRLQIGFDAQFSSVDSKAAAVDINTGVSSSQSTRYPDGGNSMYFAAVYAMHCQELNEHLSAEQGIRLTQTNLHSQFNDTTFFPFPFTSVKQQSLSLCGNASVTWRPSEKLRFSLVGSTGFRTPNVDDLSKVFESMPGSVIVPNPELGPERTWSVELNTGAKITQKINWENSFYYTWYDDAIVTAASTFNGADSILYDGAVSRVLSNSNSGQAYLLGCNSSIELSIAAGWNISGTVTYTYGRVMNDTGTSPLDHIPPVFGRIGTRYAYGSFGAEAFLLFNGKKDIRDYYLNGEDNEQYATSVGMPAWYALNLRSYYHLSDHFTVQFGIDNLLDQNYRTFASGIHAPGRNLIFSVRINY